MYRSAVLSYDVGFLTALLSSPGVRIDRGEVAVALRPAACDPRARRPEILRLLLQHGAPFSLSSATDRRMLVELIASHRTAEVRVLLAHITRAEAPPQDRHVHALRVLRDEVGRDVLLLVSGGAAGAGEAHVLQTLLSPEWSPYFDVEVEYEETMYVRTPLYHAAASGDVVGVDLLLKAGPSPNPKRNNPLFIASQKVGT